MPTVRCPGCFRALSLPEASGGEAARCPLCGREFPVALGQPGRPAGPSQGGETSDAITTTPGNRDISTGQDIRSGRAVLDQPPHQAALVSASRWLKVTAILWVIHTVVTTSFCLGLPDTRLTLLDQFIVYGAVLGRGTLPFVYARYSDALERRRYPQLLWVTACVVFADSLCTPPLSCCCGGGSLGSSDYQPTGALLQIGVLLFLVAYSTCGLIASIKLFRLLSNPEVYRTFR